jgi:hypothetical protein
MGRKTKKRRERGIEGRGERKRERGGGRGRRGGDEEEKK